MQAYKTEIKPTQEQCAYLAQAFGNTRVAYNEFISFNYERYLYRKEGFGGYEYCNAYSMGARYALAKILYERTENSRRKAQAAQCRLLDDILVRSCLPACNLNTITPQIAQLLLDTLTVAYQIPKYEPWMSLCHSKSIKQAFINAHKAYSKWFDNRKTVKETDNNRKKKNSTHPRFKSKNKSNASIYLVEHIIVERHRIKLPGLGWVRLKEYGYIPMGKNSIASVTVSRKANRYYISCTPKQDTNTPPNTAPYPTGDGLGIDLGIKNLAVLSDGTTIPNINRCKKMRRLEKKLKRQQRALNRKLEPITQRTYYQEGENKGKVQSVTYTRSLKTCKNIAKNRLAIQKTWQQITNIRHDHMNKAINHMVNQEPQFITIENLNIRGMMRNHHIAKTLGEQELYRFTTILKAKCAQHGIELRQVDRWYSSSQLCHSCGYRNRTVRNLNIRQWDCPSCGEHHDRDINAAINLRNAVEYQLIE